MNNDILKLLRQSDPAGHISDAHWATLEARIMERLAQPTWQERAASVMEQILPDFQLGRWHVPWPVVSASAVACGLVLGVMIAAVAEAPPTTVTTNRNYVLTEAVPQPWEGY